MNFAARNGRRGKVENWVANLVEDNEDTPFTNE